MSERDTNYLETLKKLGHHCEVKNINGKQVLIVGTLPEGHDDLVKRMLKYKKSWGLCFQRTEAEIESGRADGCFTNTYLPRHALPAICRGETVFAYDAYFGEYDFVFFVDQTDKIGKIINDFFSISSSYGSGFTFKKTAYGETE